MAERWIINAGRPLVLPLTPQAGTVQVVEHQTPAPPPRTQFAQRPEGSLPTAREWENRTITIKVAMVAARDAWAAVDHDFGPGAPAEAAGDGDLPGWTGTKRRALAGSTADAAVSDLLATVGALRTSSEQAITGTLTRVLASGERITFDVVDAAVDGPAWDLTYYAGRLATVTITLTCLPFGRSPERLLATASRTVGQRFVTLPDLVVPGDAPALARLVWSGANAAQQSLVFGIDQPDPSATASLQHAGGQLDHPGYANVLPGGPAFGTVATSTVGVGLWSPAVPAGTWQTIAYTRVGGSPLALSGTFRVFARMFVDAASVRLRWSGHGRETGMTANGPAVAAAGGTSGYQLVDLGLVSIEPGLTLDGIIERQVPCPSQTTLDVLLFVPVASSAVASGSGAVPGQEITHTDPLSGAGAVTGSVAPLGGTWTAATGSSTPDFTRSSTGAARVATEGAWVAGSSWRAITLPAASTAISVQLATTLSAGQPSSARPNAAAIIGNDIGIATVGRPPSGGGGVGGWAVAAGFARHGLYVIPMVWFSLESSLFAQPLYHQLPAGPTDQIGIRLTCTTSTALSVSFTGPSWSVPSIDLVHPWAPPTSGIRVGAFSAGLTSAAATAGTVEFRQLLAMGQFSDWVQDQAIWPTKTAEISSAGATRISPAGLSGAIARYEGDRPYLPPSGRDGRPARVVMGASRSSLRRTPAVDRLGESDTLTAAVYAAPRWLQIPDGS